MKLTLTDKRLIAIALSDFAQRKANEAALTEKEYGGQPGYPNTLAGKLVRSKLALNIRAKELIDIVKGA